MEGNCSSRDCRDYGEAPLLVIADQLKANLLQQGWFELQD
jgi:hypothetical protein